MDIKEFKRQIENNTLDDRLYIFKCADIDFIPHQYISRICNDKHLMVETVDDINMIPISSNIFGSTTKDTAIVCKVDKITSFNPDLLSENNIYIICHKVEKSVLDIVSDNIINIDKIEDWMIKDYVYTRCKGVEHSELDNLIKLCKNDIYRIEQECDKLSIFSESEQKYVFDDFKVDGIFNDLSNETIFSLSNALINKDINSFSSIYKQLNNIDCEPIGFITVLLNNFRNIIKVQLANNPSAETCKLPSKQFWAVKHNCGKYTINQLYSIYDMLTDLDRKIKTGQISTDILIDYMCAKILTFS